MKSDIDLDFLLKVLALTADISYKDIWWRTDGDFAPVSIFISCNGVFDEGLADCECVTPQNIHLMEEAISDVKVCAEDDKYIPMLFCARVRGVRPREEMMPKNINLRALFQMCGPSRQTVQQKIFNPLHSEMVIHNLYEENSQPNWWERFWAWITRLIERISKKISG